jgi:hypothetical protein
LSTLVQPVSEILWKAYTEKSYAMDVCYIDFCSILEEVEKGVAEDVVSEV